MQLSFQILLIASKMLSTSTLAEKRSRGWVLAYQADPNSLKNCSCQCNNNGADQPVCSWGLISIFVYCFLVLSQVAELAS